MLSWLYRLFSLPLTSACRLTYGCALAQAQGAVTGAGLLAGLGLPTAPAALRGVGHEAALALVRTLLARVARSSPAPSDARCARRLGRTRVMGRRLVHTCLGQPARCPHARFKPLQG